MTAKRLFSAILCVLWSGLFCLFPATAAAYGGGTQSERYPQQLTSEQFAEYATAKLTSELKQQETRRTEVVLIRAPQPMRLPAGNVICEVHLPEKIDYVRTVPVQLRVFVNGKFFRQAVGYYKVKVYTKALVAARNLPIDKVLTASDVIVKECLVTNATSKYLADFNELQGKVPARVIRTGTLIDSSMLQSPAVIESGAPITLIAQYNGVEVKTDGVAMGRGRIGAIIKVRNAKSGKLLRGRVIDEATVAILS